MENGRKYEKESESESLRRQKKKRDKTLRNEYFRM